MNNFNQYLIVFEGPDKTRATSVGVANNVQYAIENAKRSLARQGVNVSGFKYVSHRLLTRSW